MAEVSTSKPVLETNAQLEGRGASFRIVLWWGLVVGVLQVLSPAAFWWLERDLVWAISLVIIASIYVGFAVADGRPRVIAIELVVATGFIVMALVAITASPWLFVVGLLGHGAKDLWQHRTHFVANTRWWPPFCFIVDCVASVAAAVLLIAGVDFWN